MEIREYILKNKNKITKRQLDIGNKIINLMVHKQPYSDYLNDFYKGSTDKDTTLVPIDGFNIVYIQDEFPNLEFTDTVSSTESFYDVLKKVGYADSTIKKYEREYKNLSLMESLIELSKKKSKYSKGVLSYIDKVKESSK